MNLNNTQKIALGIMIGSAAALGYIAVLAFLSDRAYKKERKRIDAEKALDLEAIDLTGKEMKEAIESGHAHYRSIIDIMRAFDERLAFNKIAVRNK
jgi:hypothetical protein